MLGDHWMQSWGSYAFEPAIRIPFLLRLPGGSEGTVHDGIASQVDLMPTILEICGLVHPDARALSQAEAPFHYGQWRSLRLLPGRSLLPILSGSQEPVNASAVIHNDEPFLGFKARTFVTKRFKLTVYGSEGSGELFDLENDPDELHNLWDVPELRELKEQLHMELLKQDLQLAPWHPLPRWSA